MVEISVAQAVSLSADNVHLSNRPLPKAPTGYYDWQITTDTSDDTQGHSTVSNIISRVQTVIAKGNPIPDADIVVSLRSVLVFRY